MKLRHNVEIGVAYGSPAGRWDTMFIEVETEHDETHDHIEMKAMDFASRRLAGKEVAHLWVHHWSIDESEEVFGTRS